MFVWKWIFIIKTGETITVLTKQPSKTKAIIELARAHAGGDGRSAETLLKIGYNLQPRLISCEKQIHVTAAPLPIFS